MTAKLIRATHFIECVCAAHLQSYVESPFTSHGGLMIVGPPGALKSTMAEVLDAQYGAARSVSDINAQTLGIIREGIASGAIRTLVLPELAKLYERDPRTAQNVEGILRALADEGFTTLSYEDPRKASLRARATIIGAMTPQTYNKRFSGWSESGFGRRFLWSLVRLEDPHELEKSVIEWRRINFELPFIPNAPLSIGERIPNDTSADERKTLLRALKHQIGDSHALQAQIITKMLAVLRWWYALAKRGDDPFQTILSFADSLGEGGAQITLRESDPKAAVKSNGTRPRRPTVKVAASVMGKRSQKTRRKKHK